MRPSDWIVEFVLFGHRPPPVIPARGCRARNPASSLFQRPRCSPCPLLHTVNHRPDSHHAVQQILHPGHVILAAIHHQRGRKSRCGSNVSSQRLSKGQSAAPLSRNKGCADKPDGTTGARRIDQYALVAILSNVISTLAISTPLSTAATGYLLCDSACGVKIRNPACCSSVVTPHPRALPSPRPIAA
jgi:hypothetical protein